MPLSFAPRTPGLLKIVLAGLLISLGSLPTVSAQSIRLRPLTSYQETLKRYQNRKWTVDRKEFQVVNRKKWWYYLPSVGWAFGMPTVTFGTGTLAQIDRDRAVNTAKLDGLDARARLEYNEQLERLGSMYRILELEIDALKDQDVVNVIETRILKITEEANGAKEIRPEVYFTELLKFQRSRLADEAERRRLAIAVIELERFAHYNLTENELSYVEAMHSEGLAPEKEEQ